MAAIVASDIVWRGTTTAGAAGDSTANANPNTWLGKYASTTAWAGGTVNDLFDNISGAENAASTVDYRGLAILNNNAANTYVAPAAYISAETAGGASIALAADSTASLAKGSASAQLLTIATETTAPAGPLTFTSPTTFAAGVALGDIAVAFVKGLWVRRTAANTAALTADGVTLAITGDTGSL
jgi:hypothetical protein